MKSPPDQIQVPRKFGQFLDFAGIHGTLLEERTANFIDCGKGDTGWAFQNILDLFTSKRNELSRNRSLLQQLETKGH